jgi:hypothetical protein
MALQYDPSRPMPPPSHSDITIASPSGTGKNVLAAALKAFFDGQGRVIDGLTIDYVSPALFRNNDRLSLGRVGTVRSKSADIYPEFMSCHWSEGAFNILIPPGEGLLNRGAYETSHIARLVGSSIVVTMVDLRTHPEVSPFSTRAMAYWAMAPKRLHDGKPVASKLTAADALALSLSTHYGIDRDLVFSPELAQEEPVFKPLTRLQSLLLKARFGFNPVQTTHPEKRYPLLDLNSRDVARVNVALADIVTVMSRGPERFYHLLRKALGDPTTRVVGTVAALDLAKYWPGVEVDATALIHKVVAPRRGVSVAVGRNVDYRITIDGSQVETCYVGLNPEGPLALWNALKPLMEEDLRGPGRRVSDAVKSLFGGFRRRPSRPAEGPLPDASASATTAVPPAIAPPAQPLIPPAVTARAPAASNGATRH